MASTMNKPNSFVSGQVSQPASTSSLSVVEQLDLLGSQRRKPSAPVDATYLRVLPTLRRAIAYSLSLADMDPKEAYQPLSIDKASWSRMMTGQQEIPGSLLYPVRQLTGNQAGLMWLAYQDNCEIRPLRSELEQQLEDERARASELERENVVLRSLITGRK